jgi:hypothetical protein
MKPRDYIPAETIERAGAGFSQLADLDYPVQPHPTWFILDSTKLNAYISCPRAFFYEYILGWRRGEQAHNDLAFGKAAHAAMEHLYKAEKIDGETAIEAYQQFLIEYRKEFDEDTDDLFSPKTPERFLLLLIQYLQTYLTDFQRYEVIDVEVSGIVTVTELFNMYWKMDTILRDLHDGTVISLEHKTKKGAPTRTWRDDFRLSIQVGTYTHNLFCMFPADEVKGIKINGLCIHATKSPIFTLERVDVFKRPEQMEVWRRTVDTHLTSLIADMRWLSEHSDSDRILSAFPMVPTSCTKYWGCPYHDYCDFWQNPIQYAEQPPLGFREEFWDPSDQTPNKRELDGEWK